MKKIQFVMIPFFITACSSVPTENHQRSIQSDENTPVSLSDSEGLEAQSMSSSIDIRYTLGRDHYQFLIQANDQSINVTTSIDRQILEKGTIHPKRYPKFLLQVAQFILQTQSKPSQVISCRNPFQIDLKIQNTIHTAKGCRSHDGGTFSKLVHDGEFLLYSKN